MPVNIAKLYKFTKQLKVIFPDYKSSFKCPICLHDFSEADINEGKLCDAHIIPKTLGGHKKTIVCTNCDNRIGHDIEGPIVNHIMDFEKMFLRRSGKVSGGAFISIENELYPAQISTTKGKRWSIIMPNQSKFASFVKKMDSTPATIKTLLQLPRKANDVVLQAFSLKIAYLASFEHYGYKYILQKELDWVRSIINSPKSYKAPYKFSFMVKQSPFEGLEYVINLNHPDNINALIFLGSLSRFAVLVILPPLEKDSNRPFSGIGLTDKHQINIHVVNNSNSSVTFYFSFCKRNDQK